MIAEYQVTFITFIEESVVVTCHRDDAIDYALDLVKGYRGEGFDYDDVEVGEIKPEGKVCDGNPA